MQFSFCPSLGNIATFFSRTNDQRHSTTSKEAFNTHNTRICIHRMCNLNMNCSGRETGEQETASFLRGATDCDVKRTEVVQTDIRKGRTLEGKTFGRKIGHHRLNRLSASFSAKDTIKTNRTEDRPKLHNSILLLDKCAKIIAPFLMIFEVHMALQNVHQWVSTVEDYEVLQIELEDSKVLNSATRMEQATGPDKRRISSNRASFTDFFELRSCISSMEKTLLV